MLSFLNLVDSRKTNYLLNLHRRMPVLSGGNHGSRSDEFVVVDRQQQSLSERVTNVQASRASVSA